MTGKKRVTLIDVCKHANVSRMTASRVLNHTVGKDHVKEANRLAVLKSAEELGYRPNRWAQAMRTGRTGNVGLVFFRRPDTAVPSDSEYFARMLSGLEQTLLESSRNILISTVSAEEVAARRVPEISAHGFVDGLVFLWMKDRAYVEALAQAGHHVVGLDMHLRDDCPCVYARHREGGQKVAQYLWDLGHRKFGWAGGLDNLNMKERIEGYCETIDSLGGKVLVTTPDGARGSDIIAHTAAQLRSPELPTALFCADDTQAETMIGVCRELGLSVPDDISIVGYNNLYHSQMTNPPITTVGCDRREMGAKTAALITNILERNTVEQIHVPLPVTLILRASSGPPRRR